jgi:hypothetical protein
VSSVNDSDHNSSSSSVPDFPAASHFEKQAGRTIKADVESHPDHRPPVVGQEQSLAELKSLNVQKSLAEQNLFEIRNLNEIPTSRYTYNLYAAIFQFVQASELFCLSSQADTKWLWFTSYPLSLDDSADSNFGKSGPKQVGAFSITWYSAVFIALSSLDHLACIIFQRPTIITLSAIRIPFVGPSMPYRHHS